MTSINGSLRISDTVSAGPAAGRVLAATRLALRDADAPRGAWDGAWWPRTRLLIDELPGLLTALVGRCGHITRVSYSLVFWTDAPRRLVFDGRRVRLGGFATIKPYSLSLMGLFATDPIDLLVVPPEADPASVARGRDVVGASSELLSWSAGATGAVPMAPVAPAAGWKRGRTATLLPERVWENEGGSTAPRRSLRN
jgi:hypothetical protein